MSETKTLKQEALTLLEYGDGLTEEQAHQLNLLIARHLGWREVVMHEDKFNDNALEYALNKTPKTYYNLFDGDGGNSYPFLPNWSQSVDWCYRLPIPQGYRWTTVTAVEGSEYIANHAYLGAVFSPGLSSMRRGNTLPIAMLLFWWSIQP